MIGHLTFSEMLDIKGACKSQPLNDIRSMLESKKKYEEEIKSIISGGKSGIPSTEEPPEKKHRAIIE